MQLSFQRKGRWMFPSVIWATIRVIFKIRNRNASQTAWRWMCWASVCVLAVQQAELRTLKDCFSQPVWFLRYVCTQGLWTVQDNGHNIKRARSDHWWNSLHWTFCLKLLMLMGWFIQSSWNLCDDKNDCTKLNSNFCESNFTWIKIG